MKHRPFRLCAPFLPMLALAPFAAAQAPLPFQLRVQQGQNVATIADAATVAMPADAIGVATNALLTITYQGTSTATIATSEFTGSLDFSVSGIPDVPFNVIRNQTISVSITYRPSTSQRTSARIAFNFTEGTRSGTFSVNFTGTAPEFAFSYIPQGGNAAILAPDGTITFPVTAVDSTVTAAVVLTNRGTAPGTVNAITAAGDAFQLSGLPLPRTDVDAGRDLRFTVSFTPRQLDPVTGSLAIDLVNRRVSFRLQGSGQGPVWTYELIRDSAASPIAPGGTISLPDAPVGDNSSVSVRVRNQGNFEGQITTIAAQGAGFSVSDLPFLPLRLLVGGSASFTLTFTPTAAGRVGGRLRVGNDTFDVTGNGLGARLTYAYIVGSTSTAISPAGTLNFTPVSVGASTSARLQLSNTGTAAASVTSISISPVGTVFTLAGLPSLPARIEPGSTLEFNIAFAPAALGTTTATLRIDNQTFTLSGAGNPPAALPEYRFEGAAPAQEPLQQPAVRLTLTSPYPLPVSGTLALAFSSDVFTSDPAVQFATGGRTVSFTIPANRTAAVFPDGSNQIRLQTGTVAGTITLTPSFATEGGISLTPANPPVLSLTVAQTAPRILSVVLSAKTSSGFTLQITGFATSRSVTQMDFQFTAASGESLSTSRLTLNVEPSFLAYYQGSQSQQFGSQFTATVPFTLAGDVNAVSSVADTVQSVSVTMANRQGSSSAVSVNMR